MAMKLSRNSFNAKLKKNLQNCSCISIKNILYFMVCALHFGRFYTFKID